MGPILYAIFISPLFDVENLTCFADDKFPLVWNKDKAVLVGQMETKLKKITDWLTKSGMKVNESKTELCLFHRGDTRPITLNINGIEITSKSTINILGVIFDAKLQWSDHISHAIKRSMNALNAIRLIRRYFKKEELLSLVTSNFYSILYYNSEIWHLPSLKPTLKQKLLSASARALKVCNSQADNYMSFEAIHELCKRATPSKIQKFKLAICLHKLYNIEFNPTEFYLLNDNQVVTSRQRNFIILKSNKTRVGLNSLANRLHSINGDIPLEWLNLSIETFKIRCKKLYLS